MMRCLIRAVVLTLMFAATAAAQTGRARHQRLFIVPAPQSVVIDGSLEDWDLSAHIFVYVVKQTADQRSARFAMMYDDEALYIGAQVRDDSPMMNRHDPSAGAAGAWDADACQVRMVLDPAQGYPVSDSSKVNVRPNDQMVHMLLWYYTDRREPNLQLTYGMTYDPPKAGYPNSVVPRDKFEAAYRQDDDGQGYTFEYRIPWTTLEARRPPGAGDLVAGTMQLLWSTPDGLKVVKQSGVVYDVMSQAGFPWQSASCWGKFIFARSGNLPRQIIDPDEEAPDAELPLEWALTMPESGEASVALVNDQGLVVRQLMAQSPRSKGRVVERWDGLDDLGQPVPAGRYELRGAYHQGVATRFVMSIHNSGQPPYKIDDDTGGWGGDHGPPASACAAGDAMLLGWEECEAGWGIIRTDLTGRKQWGSQLSAIHLATDGRRVFSAGSDGFRRHPSVRVSDLADARALSFNSGRPLADIPEGGTRNQNFPTGLAYHAGKLFVAYAQRDLVVVNDADSGAVLATWPVPAPGPLAISSRGELLVVSGGRILAMRDGQGTTFTDQHLDEPSGIAVDGEGLVYVANHGTLHNVSVFSTQGAYLRSIGQAGGRPAIGRYDPAGMFRPSGIAVDRLGQLWVPEHADAPKRISVWDTRAGELVNEFFGGSAYATFVWIDPSKPDEAYAHSTLWMIDLDKGTWRPYSTIWRHRGGDTIGDIAAGGYVGRFRVITARHGGQFGWGGVNYGNVLFMRDGDVFKPIAGVINVMRTERFRRHVPPSVLDLAGRFPDGFYHWQDVNDDQAVQPDELHPQPIRPGTLSFNWIDADLNVWCDNGVMFRPARFDGQRPVYDFDQPHQTPFTGSNSGFTSTWMDPRNDSYDDSVYQLNPGRPLGLGKWTREGQMIWAYRGVVSWQQSVNLPPLQPGKLWGPTMPLGVAGGFTGVATYFGPFHLFTTDGRYVAMVFRDLRLGGLHPDTLTAEAFSGQLVKLGERYFVLGGDQDGRVTEVLGLDQVKPLDAGELVISEADAAQAMAARDKTAAAQGRARTLAIGRGKASLQMPSTAQRVGKSVGDRGFTAAVARDKDHLYVRFEVSTPHALTNAIADPRLVFKGGNALDIQIAADPGADPDRKAPTVGDVRLLVTRRDERTVAVLYRPKVAGFTGEPIVLSSPTGSESFDAIEVVSDRVTLEHEATATGFVATVAVPLELVGLELTAGATLRMDVGYIFGNAPGNTAALRAYWSNDSFTAHIINDVPNESRLEPARWGTAVVE